MKKKTRWNVFWMALALISTGVYIIWRIGFTNPHDKGWLSLVFFILLLVAEVSGFLEQMVMLYNMYGFEKAEEKTPQLEKRLYPHVDILVPSLNEPMELLEKTLRACKRMEYPAKERVHIYLCDDGERQEAKELAARLEVEYIGRKTHEHDKAGNLNYAMRHSTSPLVAVFDADMMPKKRFLMETVPYFSAYLRHKEFIHKRGGKKQSKRTGKDNMVGFVQTPQNFYYPDLFQYNLFAEDAIPNEQDYFYKVVQVAKNKTNSVIFGGSNAVLLREGLEEIGGFVTGVLTEDFATGIELEKAGYRGVAISKVLASGMPPKSFSALIRQRKRWARGCLRSGRKTHFLRSKGLDIRQKLNYLTAISYWLGPVKKLIYILTPVLFAFAGIVAVECTIEGVLLFWLPMYVCSNVCMHRLSQGIRTTKWTDVYDMVLFPYLLPTALTGGFGIKKHGFHVTAKDEEVKRSSKGRYVLVYLLGFLISLGAAVRMLGMTAEQQTPSYLVMIFWLCVNAYYFLMACYVAWGRNLDDAYTVQKIKGESSLAGEDGSVAQVSLEGCFTDKIRLRFAEESAIRQGKLQLENLTIPLTDRVEVSDEPNVYCFSIDFTGLSEEERDDYEAFLYDREPVLPQKLTRSGFHLDPVILNMFRHLTES